MKRLIAILCLFIFMGCSGTKYLNFYGVKVRAPMEGERYEKVDSSRDDAFENATFRTNTDDVDAWAGWHGDYLRVVIHNSSNKPIRTAYEFDTFTVITKAGRSIPLEKQGKVSYRFHAKETINPGENGQYFVKVPKKVRKSEVDRIVCHFGLMTGVRVVFKSAIDL